MKNELTQRIEQMRLEAEQMGTPLMLALFDDVQAALDTQDVEIARLTCEVKSWYSQNQQHIQDAVDFATERDAALAEIAALRRELGNAKALICEVYGLLPLLTPATDLIEHKTGNWFAFGVDRSKTIAQAAQPTGGSAEFESWECPHCSGNGCRVRHHTGCIQPVQAVQATDKEKP